MSFQSFSYTSHACFFSNRGSFSYTSRAGFFFMWGVSFTHPVLASFWCGESLLHIPCWILFLSREFPSHIPGKLHIYLGNFCYISRVSFIFIWEVSLTRPILALFFFAEFLLHIPCWLLFYEGSFSYTSRAGFFLLGSFPLGIFSDTSRAGFLFIWGVSLTHPVLAFFFFFFFFFFFYLRRYSSQIPRKLNFFLGNFCYTSWVAFIFIWGFSLTHPVLVWFLSREFLFHIPCFFFFFFFFLI